jgi:hypothetical protein
MREHRSDIGKRRIITALALLFGAAATPVQSFAQG